MRKTTFIPSPGYILLKIIGKETTSDIDVAQDTDKTPASKGLVLAVGGPALHESGGYWQTEVKVNDVIIFKPYGIETLYLNNEDCRIISFDNIRGILHEEE